MNKRKGGLIRGLNGVPEIYQELNFKNKTKVLPFIPSNDMRTNVRENNLLNNSSEFTFEKINISGKSSSNISNDQLAKLFMENNIFLNVNDSLYHWVNNKGHYMSMTNEYADKLIRKQVPEKYKHRINNSCIREIIQWIKSYIDPIEETELISNKKHLVAFRNGLFNLNTGVFSAHDPGYFFTSIINADYSSYTIKQGDNFEKFIDQVTHGDFELYLRLQELFGYVISEIRTVKYIPYLIGPKDTGKSIVLKLLEHLVGRDSFTNLSFEQLNKPEYLAQLLGKRLNTCGETSEFKLNKLDTFKKLSGGDYVTARPIYSHPVNFINSAVLVFAGNHLPKINGIDSSNAFSQRVMIFPFYNPVSKEKQDTNLLEKLLIEKDYIVQWAIKGLIRWSNNNYQFTSNTEIEKISLAYTEQTNSIDTFIKDQCIKHPRSQIYKEDFIESYINYCIEIDVVAESKTVIHDYMKSLSEISYKRFRDGRGNNKYGYIGLELMPNNREEN